MQRQNPPSYYVSIPLSGHAIASDIQAAVKEHGGGTGITYVPTTSMHITLCHFGNESLSRKEQELIKKILSEVCEKHHALDLATAGKIDFGAQNTFGKQQPLNKSQMNSLQMIGKAISNKSYETSPVESFSFCVNKITISEFKLQAMHGHAFNKPRK